MMLCLSVVCVVSCLLLACFLCLDVFVVFDVVLYLLIGCIVCCFSYVVLACCCVL